jgi:competence protein ComEA
VNRTAWLGLAGLALLAAGTWSLTRWPPSETGLACDADDVRWMDAGGGRVARCAPQLPRGDVPAGPARLLGTKFDLNRASEEELAEVPGIGRALAHALVAGRQARNGFQSWEEVDGIPGVGPAKLRLLQDVSEIRR